MAVSPYGNYEYLTKMAEKAHTGVPASVFYDMQEGDLEFDGAMEAFLARQQAKEDELFGVDELLEEEDPYGFEDEYDPEQDIDAFFDFYGDDVLDQVVDQEKQYNDVYFFLAGSGMDPEIAAAQADDAVRNIPEEDVTLLEQAYPNLPEFYEIEADELPKPEDGPDGFFSTIGDAVSDAYDSVVSFLDKDEYTGPSFASADPMFAMAALAAMSEEEEAEGDSWWEDFAQDVSSRMGTGLLPGIQKPYDETLTYERVLQDQFNRSLEGVNTPQQAVNDLLEAYQAGGMDVEDILSVLSNPESINAIQNAGFEVDAWREAFTSGIEANPRYKQDILRESVETGWEINLGSPTGFRTTPVTLEEELGIGAIPSYPQGWSWEDENVPHDLWVQNILAGEDPGVPAIDLKSIPPQLTKSESVVADINKILGGDPKPTTAIGTTATAGGTTATTDGTTGGTGGTGSAAGVTLAAADASLPDKTPDLETQFRNRFNRLEGSQTLQAQNYFYTLFNQAKDVYYSTIGWKEHPWYKPTSAAETLSESNAEKEAEMFGDWVSNTYFANTKEARFGEKFYEGVRRMRDNLVDVASWDEPAATKLAKGQDVGEHIMDQLFFAGNPDRLARVVGMYNIYPGMAPSTQAKVMSYYKNMMEGWLASKDPATGKYRTTAEFARTFIGEKPVMSAEYKGKTASSIPTPSYGEGHRLPPDVWDEDEDEGF
jgi:hypothetical protein